MTCSSEMHGGGDHRKLGLLDEGAADVMRSYQLQENPGYKQNRKAPAQREPRPATSTAEEL